MHGYGTQKKAVKSSSPHTEHQRRRTQQRKEGSNHRSHKKQLPAHASSDSNHTCQRLPRQARAAVFLFLGGANGMYDANSKKKKTTTPQDRLHVDCRGASRSSFGPWLHVYAIHFISLRLKILRRDEMETIRRLPGCQSASNATDKQALNRLCCQKKKRG